MSADKGPRTKTAKASAKNNRANAGAFLPRDPQGGREAPTQEGPARLRGSDALAIHPSDPIPDPDDSIAGVGLPMADFPSPLIGVPSLRQFRDLSAAKAGIDPVTGKTIPHVRDEDMAVAIAQMAAVGTPINTIAVAFNLRPGQIKKYYANELEHAPELANSAVALTAYRMATSGEDPATTKFWLKSRNRWKDGESSDQGAVFNLHIHE